MERFKFLKKEKLEKLPKSSGVYLFKKGEKFLYIGKTANLKERVKNHFSQPSLRDSLFINEAQKIGYLKTNSEIEALILEANLIKKYQPKYNVVWRDDKNYFFVGITKEDFPKVFITHQPISLNQPTDQRKSASKNQVLVQYVGPFVDGKSLKATLKSLRKVFPYRSCKRLASRPCLWYQLGRCPAPCLLKSGLGQQLVRDRISNIENECQQNAKSLLKILQGKKIQVLKDLKREMKKAAKLEEFEKAGKIRDRILALEKVLANAKIFEAQLPAQETNWSEIQKILKQILKTKKSILRIEAYDASNIQGKLATGSMAAFIAGVPDKNFYRRFKIKIEGKPNDVAMIKEILKRRLKHPEWPYPDLILIDGGKAQLNAAISCLTYDVKHIGVAALAKRKNELFIEGKKKPILLKNLPREISNLILQLRDEAHRFARKYHLKLRTIDLLKTK